MLTEAEAALTKGCVSHNYFWFYREAIDVALDTAQWSEAERYCLALERYSADEPLPWSELFVARGRALVRSGQGERSADLAAELDRVASVVKTAEFTACLPAVVAAIDAV